MADIQREGFEILLTADPTGVVSAAKTSAEALGTTATATKSLGEEMDRTKQATEAGAEASKEGAKHVKLFGEHAHEARAAVKGLGEVIPGVGGLAREMFSPATLAIGLFSAGIGMLIEHIQELDEEEKRFVEEAGKGLGDMLHLQAEKARDAATAHAQLAVELAKSATGETTFATAMTNRIALFDTYVAALKKVTDAEDEAAENTIKRNMATGATGKDQGEAQLDAIKRNREDRNANLDAQSEANRLAEEKRALASAQGDVSQAAAAAAAQGDAVREKELRGKFIPGAIESEKGGLAEAQKKLDKAIADYDKAADLAAKAAQDPYGASESPLAAQNALAEAAAKLQEATRERDARQSAITSGEKEALRIAEELPKLKSDLEDALKRLHDDEQIIKNFPGQITQHEATRKIHQESDQKTQAIREAEAAGEKARKYAESVANVDPKSPDAVVAVTNLTRNVYDLFNVLDDLHAKGIADYSGLHDEIGDLKKQIDDLKMRVSTSR